MKFLRLLPLLGLASLAYAAIETTPPLLVAGLDGPVTPAELAAFKAYAKAQTPPATPWGKHHNAWAFYEGGPMLESLDLLYEMTGDVDFLNQAVRFADACISQRNDLLPAEKGGQRVLWTGQIEKVWCPEAPDSKNAHYAGCEGGDAEGHVARCAELILRHPELAATVVPDGDPFHYGSTYGERARTYIDRCDEVNDTYFLKYFVQKDTHLIRDPENQPAWAKIHNNLNAINRQMMFDNGFQRLAECHELLKDDPSRVVLYDAIVKASATECMAAIRNYDPSTVNGKPTYNWPYFPWSKKGSEGVGHGAYDAVGIYRIFFRNAYGVSYSEVIPMANTMAYVIARPDGHFSATVDGKGTIKEFAFGNWLLMADFNPDVYRAIGGPALAKGWEKDNPWLTACLLYIKERRANGISPLSPPAAHS